ncbi:MAG: class I lanthipeptide [Bacteroidales bacterium]|nr:class I lanthipeptide [Bacteroidales bacterium]
MKKKKFNKKLALNKEIVANLNEIKGGINTPKTFGCCPLTPPTPTLIPVCTELPKPHCL